MEPKVLAGDAPASSGRPGKVRWLPAVLLTVAVLAVLLALGSTMSAQSVTPASPMADPWATQFCLTYGMACATGDFDGDGDDDIIAFNRTVNTTSPVVTSAGDVWVMRSNGTSFEGPERWRTGFAVNGSEIPKVGDFNGDGKDDIIVFVRGDSGDAFVSLSNGYGFVPLPGNNPWITGFCKASEICDVGDFNGDGQEDIARFTRNVYITNLEDPNWGKVYVALSNGTQFSAISYSWIQHFCMGPLDALTYPEVCGTGDFDGDGLDDVIAFSKDGGTVWVALNSGALDFDASSRWSPSNKAFCYGNEVCGVGDFNGDGRDDVITYLRSLYAGKVGWVYVGLSNGADFPSETITRWVPDNDGFCVGNEICGSGATMDGVSGYGQISRTGDFNGDTHDDVVRFLRNTNGTYPGYVYVRLAYGNSFVDYLAPTQTPTPSQTPTSTATATVTNTPTITPTPSNTPTPMTPLIWVPMVSR
jgi:hypothetical protein